MGKKSHFAWTKDDWEFESYFTNVQGNLKF